MAENETKVQRTIREFRESLTGFEKLGIAEAFGKHFSEIDDDLFPNAMAFVVKKREGLSHSEAKDAALGMSDKQINAMFDLDGDDGQDDPRVVPPVEFGGGVETEAGKGDDSPA